MTRARLSSNRFTLCLLAGMGWLAGCGGETPSPTPDSPAAPATLNNSAAPVVNPPTEQAQNEPDQLERKWIGNIPYDVFFDQPLVVATDTRPVAPDASASPVSPPVNPDRMAANSPIPLPESPSPQPGAGGAGPDWREVLPMAVLVEEVKVLRTKMNESLGSLGKYNQSFKSLANDAAVLGALSALVSIHPEQTSWKSRSPHIRELAKEISGASTAGGREKFSQCEKAFEKLTTLLDGGTAPAETPPASLPLAEVVQVADLMQRIDSSFTSLKANVRAPSDFKNDASTIERELRVMLALGTVIADRSYDSADQPGYQQQQQAFTTGLREALTAAQGASLDGFQSALGRVQTSCAECHRQYRSGDTGF